jgi:hypothetical protein
MAALLDQPIHHDSWQEWLIYNQFWGLVFLSLAVVALVAANIVDRFRPPPPPYVLVTSVKGEPLGKLYPVTGTANVPDIVTRRILHDWLEDVFTIENRFDEESMIRLPRVYRTMLKGGQAAKAVTAFYKADKDANNPIVYCYKGWQLAIVSPVLKLPADDTYEGHVQTVRYSSSGQITETKSYRLIMHVIVGLPSATNDLGLGVDDVDISLQEQK